LATIAEIFSNEPEVGLVAGALIAPPPAKKWFAICPELRPAEALYDPIATNRTPPAGWDIIGANYAIRKCVIEQLGPEDECLGPGTPFPAANETDYKLRFENAGIKMRSTSRSVVYHKHGYRYGLKASLNFSKNYALGNGALAAKLTLMGDPRGKKWLATTRREAITEMIKQLRFYRLPFSLRRLWYYYQGYNQCLREYRVVDDKLLYPKKQLQNDKEYAFTSVPKSAG
jgi:GT2 family glycosyltransferase